VVVSRYRRDATVIARFSSYGEIDQVLLGLRCDAPEQDHEIWITDISWSDPAVNRHLRALIGSGVRVHWIDHHRTAVERSRAGHIDVPFTGFVLREDFAASRLAFDYVQTRLAAAGAPNDWLPGLERLVAMADDNDRWIHQIPGSRDLALAVGAMESIDAYHEWLHNDAEVIDTPRVLEAKQRARAQVARSMAVAQASRIAQPLPGTDGQVVAAVCFGYASEIADAWGKTATNTVFAFFDAQSLTVSLRRSPDCRVDLAGLAQQLGGGGHPAAAGCELGELRSEVSAALARLVAGKLVPAA